MERVPIHLDKWQEPNEKDTHEFTEPSEYNLLNLVVGDSVKIDNKRERFWVKITKLDSNAIYGKVDNNLIIDKKYNYKDMVLFGKQHIFDILKIEEKNELKSVINSI